MVAMPVRVKPPPAEIGRDHFADLRVLGDDDALKRSADGAVVHGLLRFLDARLRSGYLGFGEVDLGLQAVGGGAGIVELLLRLHTGLLQLVGAVQLDLGVLQLHLPVGDRCLGRIAVSLGGIQRSLGVGIVQGGQELTFVRRACLRRRTRR